MKIVMTNPASSTITPDLRVLYAPLIAQNRDQKALKWIPGEREIAGVIVVSIHTDNSRCCFFYNGRETQFHLARGAGQLFVSKASNPLAADHLIRR